MLVFTRKVGEEIVIGDDIRVTVVAVTRDKVRIGIAAPRRVRVDRKEVADRRAKDEAGLCSGEPEGAGDEMIVIEAPLAGAAALFQGGAQAGGAGAGGAFI